MKRKKKVARPEYSEYDACMFTKIGLADHRKLDTPVMEIDDDSKRPSRQMLFVKFMSDAGKRDFEQGNAFAAYLTKHRIKHERLVSPAACKKNKEEYMQCDDRKFYLRLADFISHFGDPFEEKLPGHMSHTLDEINSLP
jgi:hypothetical protein